MADSIAQTWIAETTSTISVNALADALSVLSGVLPQTSALYGTVTDRQPIKEARQTLAGFLGLSGSGNDYFYNRIIISTPSIAAGNVVSNQIYTINIWNGFFVNRTLTSISSTGSDGATLTPGEALPSTFSALEEQVFTLQIATSGPALINASYTLTFDNGAQSITATGSRVFAWNYFPNWANGVLDKIEFLTDIIQAYDGNEQRISLRNDPVRSIEYSFQIDNNDDRRKFEALLFNWGAQTWVLPIWTEGSALTSPLSAGSNTITPSRLSGDYLQGGNLIIRSAAFTFEVCQIATIVSGVITLQRPTINAWPAGAVVYPALPALLDDAQQVDRFTGDTFTAACRFRLTDYAMPPAYTPTTYRGFPVITVQPLWLQDLTAQYTRKFSELFYDTGKIVREDEAGLPFVIMSHHWRPTTKAEIDQLKGFLYYLRGRQKMIWLPSFLQDIVVISSIGNASTSIDVSHGFITQHLLGKIGRRDIRIESTAGAVFYRRVSGASELSASVERLTIDSALGVALAPENIARVSWMMPARLNSDAVEMAYGSDIDLACSVEWRGVRDDV